MKWTRSSGFVFHQRPNSFKFLNIKREQEKPNIIHSRFSVLANRVNRVNNGLARRLSGPPLPSAFPLNSFSFSPVARRRRRPTREQRLPRRRRRLVVRPAVTQLQR